MVTSFSPGALIDQARSDTGPSDLGSQHFEVFLQAWCEDLASERLSAAGREQLARAAVRNLRTRLLVHEALKRAPEIADVVLPPTVRIMGFPRSGTTLLHNLMAAGPQRRALLRWELLQPLPPPEAPTYATDPRIAQVQRSVEGLRGSELERMHWVEAADPEECTWGFIDLSGLIGRGTQVVTPRWAATAFDAHRETYEEYRRVIQILLVRNPLPPGSVLVLKSPADTVAAPLFLDAFPESTIVLIHRDPYRVTTSTMHIAEVVGRPFVAPGVVFSDDEREPVLRSLREAADAMVNLADTCADRVHSVQYAELVRDPVVTVLQSWQDTGHAVEEAAGRDAVTGFLDRQRRGGRATPLATYDDHGLDATQARTEPAMARYIAAFDVPVEATRVTGTT